MALPPDIVPSGSQPNRYVGRHVDHRHHREAQTALAERLRESGHKLQVYSKLVDTLQQEVDRLMPTPRGKHRR